MRIVGVDASLESSVGQPAHMVPKVQSRKNMQSFHGAGNWRPADDRTPVGDAGPTSTAAGSESGLHAGHLPLPERHP
jgi:hypothetical protein